MNRDDAWTLLTEYTKGESLQKHALGVEAAVRGYARKFGEDEEAWGITALLHDFDYERWPDEANHPYRGVEILAAQGYPEVMRTAIMGHAPYTGTPRATALAKYLFACDELAGFVTAVALIKPSKKLADVELAGVKKRLKEKAFARGVHREEVYQGTEEIGLPLDEHIQNVITALQAAADRLGM